MGETRDRSGQGWFSSSGTPNAESQTWQLPAAECTHLLSHLAEIHRVSRPWSPMAPVNTGLVQSPSVCVSVVSLQWLVAGLLDEYLSQAEEEAGSPGGGGGGSPAESGAAAAGQQGTGPGEEGEEPEDLEKAQLHSCLVSIVDTLRQNNPRCV